MAIIQILDPITVDKIAAGEVVDRPASIVKELVENAIDAGATSITVEIKDGGISMIRVTDNGGGIEKDQLRNAFVRHATSKITSISDLDTICSLGFRGEALSSISAVCQVELITKTPTDFVGARVCCNGGVLEEVSEVGAPDGTTIIARNIFYNTPARQKFLKSKTAEAGAINDLMEHLALSNPQVGFKYIQNGQTKFYTSGNGDSKEIIYRIYGKEVSQSLLVFYAKQEGIEVSGFLGKPILSRGSRSFELVFVNGRFIKSNFFYKLLEEAYRPFMMQHKFPFVVLYVQIDPKKIDVNVHPNKMDIRIENGNEISYFLINEIENTIKNGDLVHDIKEETKKVATQDVVRQERELTKEIPEPFEHNRREVFFAKETPVYDSKIDDLQQKMQNGIAQRIFGEVPKEKSRINDNIHANIIKKDAQLIVKEQEQLELFDTKFFDSVNRDNYHILGQIFQTYWLISLENKLYIVDQHAAHEKVKYEEYIKLLEEHEVLVQNINPPIIVSLSAKEITCLTTYLDHFIDSGFLIEEFGGNEYAIRGVPSNLFGLNNKEIFLSILDDLLNESVKKDTEVINNKIASMACKAAIKGNQTISFEEAKTLIDQLFELDNPYHCPHGRPVMISMSRHEIDKKFKRIL